MATIKVWTGSAEQIAFRDSVLASHIQRKLDESGKPKSDLPASELGSVGGTKGLKMKKIAASAATVLIAQANVDLKAALQANLDKDALVTVKISATSGYRDAAYQRDLWLDYFPNYYDQSDEARMKILDGVHSDDAIRYLLTPKGSGGFGLGGKIAAPGYSNHQAGIAIDLYQYRKAGYEILNSTDSAERRKWKKSWFHKWLVKNAATYTFYPYALEEWHWEYRG
jgi:D-alanyl-D-alanine carboxypeptidase